MKQLLGVCGIDCAACNARIATLTNDDTLRARTAAEWSKLFGHNFKPEEINCAGCNADGRHVYYCDAMCEIRKCGRDRKDLTCAECGDFACAKLTAFLKQVPEAEKNLKARRG